MSFVISLFLRYCRWAISVCLLGMVLLAQPVWAQDARELDVELFGRLDISPFEGCRFALWQHDRDPSNDRYAYVFFLPYGGDGAALPAWIEIGGTRYEINELAVSQDKVSFVSRHHFFRNDESDINVHIEVFEARDTDAASWIDRAQVTFSQSGKVSFRVSVKGVLGCPEPLSGDPEAGPESARSGGLPSGYSHADAISLSAVRSYDDIYDAPWPVVREIRSEMDNLCDLQNVPPPVYSYAISDALTLWELPCFVAAYQGSSIFAVVSNDNEDYFVLLTLPQPPGLDANDRFDAMQAVLDAESGILRTTEFTRGLGDCGTHTVYQLYADVGEVVAFDILEYREKLKCDEVNDAPASWPLVWSR